MSGQVTTLVSFIFFGFILSASLRLSGALVPEIEAWNTNWKALHPNSIFVKGWRKEVQIGTGSTV
jgi:hypothetical protein